MRGWEADKRVERDAAAASEEGGWDGCWERRMGKGQGAANGRAGREVDWSADVDGRSARCGDPRQGSDGQGKW